MRISTKTTRVYTIEFTEEDKRGLCNEIKELTQSVFPSLKALQTILENLENR